MNNKFQLYLEWNPETFKYNKLVGNLDIKQDEKPKEFPRWFKQELQYVRLAPYRQLTDPAKIPSNHVGIIATPTTAYCFDRSEFYHQGVICALMKEGKLPMEEKNLHYEKHHFAEMPFIALEYYPLTNKISFSVAYDDDLFNAKYLIKFKNIIKKMTNPVANDTKAKHKFYFGTV